jgi:hypothetical protein
LCNGDDDAAVAAARCYPHDSHPFHSLARSRSR